MPNVWLKITQTIVPTYQPMHIFTHNKFDFCKTTPVQKLCKAWGEAKTSANLGVIAGRGGVRLDVKWCLFANILTINTIKMIKHQFRKNMKWRSTNNTHNSMMFYMVYVQQIKAYVGHFKSSNKLTLHFWHFFEWSNVCKLLHSPCIITCTTFTELKYQHVFTLCVRMRLSVMRQRTHLVHLCSVLPELTLHYVVHFVHSILTTTHQLYITETDIWVNDKTI